MRLACLSTIVAASLCGCSARSQEAVGPAGPQGETGPRGETGPKGDPGPPGADGALRIFGNGSAGPKDFSLSNEGFGLPLNDANLQYTDFTVAPSRIVRVESGTIIRCTGSFVNMGTILVVGASPASSGVSLVGASPGQVGESGAQQGGFGGAGVTPFQARQLLRPGILAGGAGAGEVMVLPSGIFGGASGGGSIVVLARVALRNVGIIIADGDGKPTIFGGPPAPGTGGGGGGIVILASVGSISNEGTISAAGGPGGRADAFTGPGGGGGGGIVHFLAPTITNDGIVEVSGGSGAPSGGPGSVTGSPRHGGAGGGGTAGSGGMGGTVTGPAGAGTAIDAGAGTAGAALTTVVDPTALF